MSTTVTIHRTDEQIRDMLCNAFEGGTGYWCRIDGYKLTDGLTFNDFRQGGKMQTPGDYAHWCQLIPLVRGCALKLYDTEAGERHSLTLEKLRRGVLVMAAKCPRHFADWLNQNDDAETGDVFLQCCLFGEIVYG